jgi:3-oxoacyl-ACP reductase-like protein
LSPIQNLPPEELPVLTDILVPGQIPSGMRTTPGAGGSHPERPAAAPAPVAAPLAAAPASAAHAAGSKETIPNAALATLETQVTERVLRSLQTRIDTVIDQRLRATVGSLLEQALSGLGEELKLSVRETLKDAVQRAVAQEISRIRASRP